MAAYTFKMRKKRIMTVEPVCLQQNTGCTTNSLHDVYNKQLFMYAADLITINSYKDDLLMITCSQLLSALNTKARKRGSLSVWLHS